MIKCFLKLQNSDKVTLVELPDKPGIGQSKPISGAEIIKGPQPDGQTLGGYAVPRTVIKIVTDLGEQKYFGEAHQTFEYVRDSL